MSKDYLFTKCLNPKCIINPYTKEKVIVECGKCEACRLKSAFTRTMRCTLESLSNRFCYFVTLTYAKEYVPLVKLVSKGDGLNYEVIRYRGNCYDYDDSGNLVTSYHYPSEFLGDITFPNQYALTQLQKKQKNINSENLFYALDYYDVQLFIKRLRKKVKNERIRIFACGEYGPVHFRPHYHLLLWFSQEETLACIQQYIAESWRFGRIDGSFAKSGASSYVARYVNGNQYLPSVFKVSGTKPFSHHSRYLGEKVLQSKFETYEADEYRRFAKRRFLGSGINTDIILWRSAKARVFPKCSGFNSKSEHECVMSYRLNETASTWTGKALPIQNARIIADYVDKEGTWHPVPLVEDMLQYFITRYLNAHSPDKERFDKEKFQRMVYVELSISARFIKNNCKGNSDLIRSEYRKVKEFYQTMDYDNLVTQLKLVNDTPEDERKFFYSNSFLGYSFNGEELKKTMTHRLYSANKRSKYKDLMKHRELNDKNLMFNY